MRKPLPRSMGARCFTVLLALSLLLLSVMPTPTSAQSLPPGWLSGYTYRKKHDLTGAANAGVGYQMMFIVRRSSGTDSGNIVYVSGKCKEDFSDVRFADADGNVFPYATVYKSSDEAWIWIKPSLDLSADQTIYIYYGNPDARDESSLDNTFIFAEDWSNATLNPGRWTVEVGTPGTNIVVNTAQKRLELITGARVRSRTISFPSCYRVEGLLAQQYATGDVGFRLGISMLTVDSNNQRGDFSIHSGTYSADDRGVAYCSYYEYWGYRTTNGEHYDKIGIGHGDDWTSSALSETGGYLERTWTIVRNATNYFQVYLNGVLKYSEFNVESPNRIYHAIAATQSGRVLYIYGYKIRKYVSPEPSHGTWYAEESVTVTHARLNVNVEPSFLSYVAFTLDYPAQVLFAPWTNIITTGSHTLTLLDTKVQVNNTHVYGFKCWKKNGEVVSFDKSYTFTLGAGTTDITMVFTTNNISIVSQPEMYVRLEIEGWQVQTPTNVYRGAGYYNFKALDTQLYYNATHMLRFYGWYVDNVYIGSDTDVNIYISYNTRIKLAYKYVEIPAPPPMTFKAQIVELGTVLAGSSRDFAVTVLFDANALNIQSVEFTSKGEWLQVVDALPMQATKGVEAVGTATINCRLTVPQNVQGYYTIPFKVTAKTSNDVTLTTASYITFTATTTPTAVEAVSNQPTLGGYQETIMRIFGNPLILILLIALTIWLASYTLKKR